MASGGLLLNGLVLKRVGLVLKRVGVALGAQLGGDDGAVGRGCGARVNSRVDAGRGAPLGASRGCRVGVARSARSALGVLAPSSRSRRLLAFRTSVSDMDK